MDTLRHTERRKAVNGKRMGTDFLAFGIVLAVFLGFLYLSGGDGSGTGDLSAQAQAAADSCPSQAPVSGPDSAESINSNESQIGQGKKIYEVLLTRGAEYTIPWVDAKHEMGEISDAHVRLGGIRTTKEYTGYDVYVHTMTEGPPGHPDSEIQDSAGNLISAHSYVVLDMELTNQGERTFETAVNRFRLVAGMKEAYELRGYNAGHPWDDTRSDHFHVTLLPEYPYDFTLVYVVPDDILEQYRDELYLLSSFIDTGNGDDWRGGDRPVIRKAE